MTGRKPTTREARPGGARIALVVAALVLLGAGVLANSMTKPIGRDEQMYCTAGVLTSKGQLIYRDFSYPSQLPYHPLLLASLYKLSGTTRYLLVGRLLSVLCDVGALVLIVLIYRRAFGPARLKGTAFGAAGAALFVFNPLVDYAAGYAWNHDVVVFCVLLSFYLYATIDFRSASRYWRLGLIGALLTVATFMRVTTALVETIFLTAVVVMAGGSAKNRVRTAVPFVLGALLAAAWPLSVIARATAAFQLNLLRIPTLYGDWLAQIGMTHGKVDLTVAALSTPGYVVLILTAVVVALRVIRRPAELDERSRRMCGLAVALAAAFFLIAYIPPTMWRQYLAVPVPFVVVSMAYPIGAIWRGHERPQQRMVNLIGATVTVVVVLANPPVLQRIPLLLVPERWTPTQLHATSVDIASRIGGSGPVLTLGPLQALEGGSEIYPELSCGSIVYRIADRLTPQERDRTGTVGPEGLAELVRARSPAGILVGIEPPYFSFLEDPLRRQVGGDWVRKLYDTGWQLYAPPSVR